MSELLTITPRDRAYQWMAENQEAVNAFVEAAREFLAIGRPFSAKVVAEHCRYHVPFPQRGDYKLPNAHVAYLAREAAARVPELREVWRFNKVKGEK